MNQWRDLPHAAILVDAKAAAAQKQAEWKEELARRMAAKKAQVEAWKRTHGGQSATPSPPADRTSSPTLVRLDSRI